MNINLARQEQEVSSPNSRPAPRISMPIDDYASAGGGALRLKGAKVTKKKKRKDKSGLEKALSGGDGSLVKADRDGEGEKKRKKGGDEQDEDEREEDRPLVKKTEAEKRIDELKRKRVGLPLGFPRVVMSAGLLTRHSSSRWRRTRSRGRSC
ncbi:DUF1754 domain-containing protein [Candidatus Bathyarchaeota archaeon]|nr:DUF1754 domain-containing protein [Candidatus Bathyarchaeota archaeon]